MRALLLNSGMGKRMGVLNKHFPKCMNELWGKETVLGRQLRILEECGITNVVITTGYLEPILVKHCYSLGFSLDYTFVNNPVYAKTNYIYSIYLAQKYLNDDILLIHGHLVFDSVILSELIKKENSCMVVSSTAPLPQKDFKAVIKKGVIVKIGVEYFDDALTAQPLYKINKDDWMVWLDSIIDYCEAGQVSCYAENAFNDLANRFKLYPLDCKNKLCAEVDTPEDLLMIKNILKVKDEPW